MTPGPATFDREAALGRLAHQTFDVLVVGGGVTGCGVALDSASRGLSTALVEARDFASGTSSKSSKMIHGGLRYLQQNEYRLVYENLAERQRLLDNAPHLVSPLPFLIPLFGKGGTVSKTVARGYSVALWTYDLTGGLRIGSRHRRIGRADTLRHFPLLAADRLVAGFLYYDARADDARLTLTLARTAALDHGAVVANYTAVEGFTTGADGQVDGALVRPAGGEPFPVRARVVVNATGVWADDVRAMDEGVHPHAIRPAKGVHVTVPRDRFPCDIAAVIPVPADRRSIFVVPWPEADLVYLGTTDTAYQGPLDDPVCTPEDVGYLLAAANGISSAGLTRADVTGVWAGLRPLLAPQGRGGQVSERTADLSRRHTVTTSGHGVVTVTGGKLTTYRKMAEDTVDVAVRRLGGSAAGRRCVTRRLPLHGSPAAAKSPTAKSPTAKSPTDPGLADVSPAVAAHLRARYGTDAAQVLAVAEGRPELLDPVVPSLPYLGAEVVYAARHEMARTVDDVLARRTRALLQQARATADAAPAVARLLGGELGWSDERVEAEAAGFAASARAELAAAGLDPGVPDAAPAVAAPSAASSGGDEPAGSADHR